MMTGRESAGARFNEQAALEELERLQHAIQESRRQRGQTVEEFDAFVRSFKNPAPERATTAPPVAVRSGSCAGHSAGHSSGSAAAARDPRRGRPRCRRRLHRCRSSTFQSRLFGPRGRQLGFRTLIAGLAAIAVVVVAAVLLLNRRGADDAAPAPQPPRPSPMRP